MMYKKLRKTWTSLDRNITVNKRELLLGVTACTLAGVLLGMFLSPSKTVTIGSNNGNNNTGNKAALDGNTDPEDPESDESGE